MRSFFVFILLIFFGAMSFGANLYQTLGVSPDATQDVIKKAWRSQIRNLHPDRAEDNEAIRLVNAAENVLGNPELRAYYDFLSDYGANHERWETTPGKTILETLRKRYGPASELGTKAYRRAETSSAGTSAADDRERNPVRQNQIIDQILRKDIADEQKENLAKTIARFIVTDAGVAARLGDFFQNEDPQMRMTGLVILKAMLREGRLADLSSDQLQEFRLFLLRNLNDTDANVRLKAIQSIADTKISQDREIFAKISELAADSSFEVAWRAQVFLSREDRLLNAENFWNFLKFIKKYETRNELKMLTSPGNDRLTDILPLQTLYRLRQLPDDEDVRRELVDLLSSPNEMLAKVVARLLYRCARNNLDYGDLIKIENRSEMLFANERLSLSSMIAARRTFGGHLRQDPKPLLIDLGSRNPEKVRMSLRLLVEIKDLNESQLKSVTVVLRNSMLEYRQTGSQVALEQMRGLLRVIQNSKYRGAVAEDLRYFAYNVGNENLSIAAKNIAQISPVASPYRRPILSCDQVHLSK